MVIIDRCGHSDQLFWAWNFRVSKSTGEKGEFHLPPHVWLLTKLDGKGAELVCIFWPIQSEFFRPGGLFISRRVDYFSKSVYAKSAIFVSLLQQISTKMRHCWEGEGRLGEETEKLIPDSHMPDLCHGDTPGRPSPSNCQINVIFLGRGVLF